MHRKSPVVFVAISFDNKYYQIFNLIQAIAGVRGVISIRADESRGINPKDFSAIKEADLIIAEISSGSPNVIYELGWAHALGKHTMILAENGSIVPFDINDYQIIKYDPKISPQALRKQLEYKFDEHLRYALSFTNLRKPLLDTLSSIEEITSRDDLFTLLLGWTIDEFAKEAQQWTSNSIRLNSTDTIQKQIKTFQIIKKNGFSAYVIPQSGNWRSDDRYSEGYRLAAQVRGVKIERVFILPNHEALFNESLRNHINKDEQSGVHTFIAFIDNISDFDAVRDFWILDNELLSLIESRAIGGETRMHGSIFTRDESILNKAKVWQDIIMATAQPSKNLFSTVDNLDNTAKQALRTSETSKNKTSSYNPHTEAEVPIQSNNKIEEELESTQAELQKFKFILRIIAGCLILLFGIIFIFLIPNLLAWEWLINHPKKLGLQLSIILIFVGVSWIIVDGDKTRKWFAFSSIIIGALLAITQII